MKGSARGNIKYSLYGKYKTKINQYNGFEEYPATQVQKLMEGCEHPKRFVSCFICTKLINTTEDFIQEGDGNCFHSLCIQKL